MPAAVCSDVRGGNRYTYHSDMTHGIILLWSHQSTSTFDHIMPYTVTMHHFTTKWSSESCKC